MLENDINIKDNMLASIYNESYDKEDSNIIIVSSGGSGSSQLTVSPSNEKNEGPTTTTEPQPATTITATTTASKSSNSAATTVNSDEEDPAATRRRAEWPLTGITEPGINDCLFGRGAGINRHPGNKHYLNLVDEKKEKYLSSKKSAKFLVALEIVNEWRSLNPPGRFLKQDEATKLWNDVGEKKAQEKVSLALRGKERVKQFEVGNAAAGGGGSQEADCFNYLFKGMSDGNEGLTVLHPDYNNILQTKISGATSESEEMINDRNRIQANEHPKYTEWNRSVDGEKVSDAGRTCEYTKAGVNADEPVVKMDHFSSTSEYTFKHNGGINANAASHSIRQDQAAETNLDDSQHTVIGGKTMESDYDASDEDADGGAVDEGDDAANSVSSTKSYYRDLCVRLTFALEKKNSMESQTRIENQRLKEEIAQLRR